MRKVFLLIIILVTVYPLCAGNMDSPGGEPDGNRTEHRLYIGFKADQPLNSCTQVIKRFSGTVVEKLREFNYPVFLVSIENTLSASHFQKEILPEIEQENGVHFVSLERDKMKNPPLMAIESSSLQRQGSIRIPAPGKISYDFVKNPSGKNAFHQVLERHLPGLKARISQRAVNRPDLYAVFEVEINKEGEVEQVRILANNITDSELRSRLKEKMYTWKDFPRRTSDDLVTLRFRFRSR